MDLTLSMRLGFTVPAFLWAAYYFYRATKQSRWVALGLLVIVGYALLIEATDIRTTHGYVYANLPPMVGSPPGWVPLSICVSWAAIIFIAMTTSDRLGLPWYQRPLTDGLVAVATDLVGDPVFSNTRRLLADVPCFGAASAPEGGLGLWTWCVSASQPASWITVPYGNFFGWFLVVAALSFFYRLGAERMGGGERAWPKQLLMLIVLGGAAALAVFALLFVYDAAIPAGAEAAVFWGTMLLSLMLIVLRGRRLNVQNRFDLGIVLMPLFTLMFSLYVFFSRGIDRASWPGSAVLVCVAAVFSASLLLLPYARALLHGRRQATT